MKPACATGAMHPAPVVTQAMNCIDSAPFAAPAFMYGPTVTVAVALGLAAVGAGAAAYEVTKATNAQAAAHAATTPATPAISATTWYVIAGIGAAALLGIILLVKA